MAKKELKFQYNRTVGYDLAYRVLDTLSVTKSLSELCYICRNQGKPSTICLNCILNIIGKKNEMI